MGILPSKAFFCAIAIKNYIDIGMHFYKFQYQLNHLYLYAFYISHNHIEKKVFHIIKKVTLTVLKLNHYLLFGDASILVWLVVNSSKELSTEVTSSEIFNSVDEADMV